jgi:hypothetical protein
MAVIIEESIAPAFFSVACRQDPLSITHVPSILAAILIGGSAAPHHAWQRRLSTGRNQPGVDRESRSRFEW